jgi:hypothetical protein
MVYHLMDQEPFPARRRRGFLGYEIFSKKSNTKRLLSGIHCFLLAQVKRNNIFFKCVLAFQELNQ